MKLLSYMKIIASVTEKKERKKKHELIIKLGQGLLYI